MQENHTGFISAEALSVLYYCKEKRFYIVLQITSVFIAIDEILKHFKMNNRLQR